MKQYYFDDAYECVYVWSEENNAWIHDGSYLTYGIDVDMTLDEKIEQAWLIE